MSLCRLPSEIFLCIGEWIPGNELINFACVNRHVYSVLERSINSMVRLQEPESTCIFLQAVLDRPVVGERVRSLFVDYVPDHCEDDLADLEHYIPRFAKAAREDRKWPESLVEAFEGCGGQAAVLLLLHCLPKIQRLRMQGRFDAELFRPFVKPLTTKNQDPDNSPEGLLGSLQQFTAFHSNEARGGTNLRQYVPLFFLPSLTKIQLYMTKTKKWEKKFPGSSAPVGESDTVMSDLFGKSPVTEIELSNSVVNGKRLGEIIRLPRQLKKLTYRMSNSSVSDEAEIIPIGRALLHVQDTLEELDIRIVDCAFGSFGWDKNVGSLRSFSVLRELVILSYSLPTKNIGPLLPKSLKKITFIADRFDNDIYYYTLQIEELLRQKSIYVPDLETVCLGPGNVGVAKIQKTADEVGVLAEEYQSRIVQGRGEYLYPGPIF
ncbi:hypothetical protein FQN54_009586 [Arachnomyces sp. PD_36]|nr:hypothetical protein FQN54_009586 [Arachnomyces sp. PD_36]